MQNILDKYYGSMNNVVLRDVNNNPSVFVRHPAQKSSEFDIYNAGENYLPNKYHPAFFTNKEDYENNNQSNHDKAVLWSKYFLSELNTQGVLYSLPNATPKIQISYDEANRRIKNFNSGVNTNVTMMTIADHGLLTLMLHYKELGGIEMYGNTVNGVDTSIDAMPYTGVNNYTAGQNYTYGGFLWECLKTHSVLDGNTVRDELLPPNAPMHWKKIKKVGGTQASKDDSSSYSNYYGKVTGTTLTGSGPNSWYLFGNPDLEADMCGNVSYFISDAYFYKNQFRFIPYNQAANPLVDATDKTSVNTPYRVIAYDIENQEWTFDQKPIDPDATSERYKILHLHVTDGSHYMWTIDPDKQGRNNTWGCFKDLTIDQDMLNDGITLPPMLYELGLMPLPGSNIKSIFNVNCNRTDGVICSGDHYMRYNDRLWHTVPFIYLPTSIYGNNNGNAGGFRGARARAREI